MAGQAGPGLMDRRALLARAILLVGGAAALPACGRGGEAETGPARALLNADGRYFSADRMARLERIAEIVIPSTDTPGAREAGVADFVDSMMVDWAGAETRLKWDAVLDAVDARARAGHGAGFLDLAAQQQEEVVAAYDAEAIAGPDGAYRQFKELLLIGYYHSEIGATQELHYELVPGAWRACAPLSEVGRTWAD